MGKVFILFLKCLAVTNRENTLDAGRYSDTIQELQKVILRWQYMSRAQEKSGGGRWTLGSHSWMDCLAAELFLNICFLDTVFGTLFYTAVQTAVSGVHKLLRTGRVPTSWTLLFWRWMTVSSVFAGRNAWISSISCDLLNSLSSSPSLSLSLSLCLWLGSDSYTLEEKWCKKRKRGSGLGMLYA